jgi:dTDP-4-amino-4,6-dideoxygalactose transaminase
MTIPLYDRTKLYRNSCQEIDAGIARVLNSGRFEWGDEVPQLEGELASWLGAPYMVATGSGTAAIKAALRAVGIGPGDEVITVANTDMAGSTAIHAVGATAVWVDIDPDSRCMDVAACEAAISPRTAALLPVDMYGHPSEMLQIEQLAEKHGLAVIEDACLALGAEIDGIRVGNFADVTCFSFSSGKHLGAIGNAGGCSTGKADIADRLRLLSGDGQRRDRHYMQPRPLTLLHEAESHNDRMDEIQAAVLRAKLPLLESTLALRRAQAERYSCGLANLVSIPKQKAGYLHAWRNYVVELDARDALAAHLHANGVQCNALYSPPVHLQPVYENLGYRPGSLPITEKSARRLLGLPIGPHLALDDIDSVVRTIGQRVA